MTKTVPEKFIDAIRPFLTLWESVRVTGMASYTDGRWFNVGIRIQLEQHPPSKGDISSPDQRFLCFVKDYRLESLTDFVGQLVNGDFYRLENNSQQGGGAFIDIWFKKPSPNSPQPPPRLSWYGPASPPNPDATPTLTLVAMAAWPLGLTTSCRDAPTALPANPGFPGIMGGPPPMDPPTPMPSVKPNACD